MTDTTPASPIPHLQSQQQADWEAASDEEIVVALFQPVRFVNPCWMNYLKKNRPGPLAAYLQMHASQGGYLGSPARRFLRGR
jgi:hypothetical protein